MDRINESIESQSMVGVSLVSHLPSGFHSNPAGNAHEMLPSVYWATGQPGLTRDGSNSRILTRKKSSAVVKVDQNVL